MQLTSKNIFTTIKTEGGLLPPDILQKITSFDKSIDGLSLESYQLNPNERINEAISRSWNRLVNAWQFFKKEIDTLPETDMGITVTRRRWLLVLFQELGYGYLSAGKAIEINGKTYPISHFWRNSPIHLVGCRINLDKRTAGIAGAARISPHSLVQEFLNCSTSHLWGFVSNGLYLRVLRDNISITRQAYIEFNLEAMMEGQIYSDFVILWLLCHQSRVEADKPENCWLECWMKAAKNQGIRALDHLREGVEEALKTLGKGFLAHPSNTTLREKISKGSLNAQSYYRQLLRLVYRLIFLFVAEDRNSLFLPNTQAEKEFYLKYYSASRLRNLSERIRGSAHSDLFYTLRIVMKMLGNNNDCKILGLPVLGSFLWSEKAIPDLIDSEIKNDNLLKAIFSLSFIIEGKTRRAVDYHNLGSEELGSIYESLLELHPTINLAASDFDLLTISRNERKTTGTYYTDSGLIKCLLDTALDPVIKETIKKENPEKALLNLKICDPACGSGHFLIAAAHRIGKNLAAVRTGDNEPSPKEIKRALRDVIGHCIYGVDLNPMAVELCKVALWMEALEPGKPLSFLDHKILCGNSLLGATPRLYKEGIPDSAFEPIEGDDRKYCQKFKKMNKQERSGQRRLFDAALKSWKQFDDLSINMLDLEDIQDDSMEGIRKKQQKYQEFLNSNAYRINRFFADLWCSAFVWKKKQEDEVLYPITQEIFKSLMKNPMNVPEWIVNEVKKLTQQYKFFHWHIMFPDVFFIPQNNEVPDNLETGWQGGFDVVLGNPPWERIKLQEKEWFKVRRPDISDAPNAAARRRMIKNLEIEEPALFEIYLKDKREAEGQSHFIRNSSKYPLCGRGDINTYAVFAELKRQILNNKGRLGCVIPTGIATDDTTKYFFADLVTNKALASLYDFENRKKIFPSIDSRMKFCLLTLTGKDIQTKEADFMFFALETDDLEDQDRHFTLSPEDILLLNPNTKTCPIFRTKRDAEITKEVYQKIPVFVREGQKEINPFEIQFLRMFDMTNDSYLFKTYEQLDNMSGQIIGNNFIVGKARFIPLYEAKMIWHYDHRFGSYKNVKQGSTNSNLPNASVEDYQNPNYEIIPRYWVKEESIKKIFKNEFNKEWLLGFRGITNSTNERTIIFDIFPKSACSNSLPVCSGKSTFFIFLCANASSFVLDYIGRLSVGGTNLNFFIIKQLPFLPPDFYKKDTPWCKEKNLEKWIKERAIELLYTSYGLRLFAKENGYNSPPFKWNDNRRFFLKCELDAAYFHLYGIDRDDADYIMDTFPIVKHKDEQNFGEYRTKKVILEIYDEMAEAIRTGIPYKTKLDPPPADPRVAHSDP